MTMTSSGLLLQNSDLYTYEYFLQEDVCRFCWTKNAAQEILPPASQLHSDKSQIADKIRDCIDIDLSLIHNPNKVCASCFSNIEKFYEFKKFCKDTDRRLREIVTEYEGNPSSKAIESLSTSIKLEKVEDFSNLELTKTPSFDSFLDSLQHSDTSNCELPGDLMKKKVKVKKKYKPKRSSTYCNICRISFEDEEKISLHNAVSHGVEKNGEIFKCFGCEKRFKSRKTRLNHEINFCKGLKDGYKCSLCDRYLPKRGMYEAHMRDHRDNPTVELPEDIFKCTKCYKLFKTRENLRKHMGVHESEKKNFVCESCGRVFTRQDYLHKHKLTHTGVKQHVCAHCGFRATQRSSLTVHMRKHTGERPYSCDVCPQRCVSSSNLRAHRRRHLGVKGYECTICPKKFGYKISLEEHVASTHERPQLHPCPHCGAVYTRIRGLRRHLLAKHGKGAKDKDSKSEKDGPEKTDLYLKWIS